MALATDAGKDRGGSAWGRPWVGRDPSRDGAKVRHWTPENAGPRSRLIASCTVVFPAPSGPSRMICMPLLGVHHSLARRASLETR
jgi:hypothetical protein